MKRALFALFALVAVLATGAALADDGHNHGAAPAAASTNGPQRLPDGSVFLPKPAQRQMALRTMATVQASLPRAIELNGRITLDPNAGGRVQALAAGRLAPGPRGLPVLGQAVRKGEVLAYVEPAVSALERSGQAMQLAEFRAARALADKRLARLRALADTVPRREIEAAESEIASLAERSAAVQAGLAGREALVAPVAGVVAASQAVAGMVVDARELVFEIVDPNRMQVEALAFDADVAADVASASLAVGQDRVPLRFVGAARTLREQALPLQFAAEGAALRRFAVGQPVQVVVRTRSQVQGMAVPAAALVRNAANQTTVWVKTAPERFTPRVVTVAPLDGARVAVTSGLQSGDLVVHEAANLLNQIR